MKVVVRTDSSDTIGTGHAMRCLTLSRALRARLTGDGYHLSIVFASRVMLPGLAEKLHAYGMETLDLATILGPPPANDFAQWDKDDQIRDVAATLQLAGPVDCAIVDHYGLDATWDRRASLCKGPVVVIDDLADRQHHADIIVDQTFQDDGDRYRMLNKLGAKHLVGPDYSLLNPDFAALTPGPSSGNEKARLLINLGGACRPAQTTAVLRAVAAAPAFKAFDTTLLTGIQTDAEAAKTLAATAGTLGVTVRHFVDDMPSFLNGFDLAIGAGGVSSLERCAAGVSSLILVLADNQRAFAKKMRQKRAVFSVHEIDAFTTQDADDFLAAPQDKHSEIATYARALCDGGGTGRVVDAVAAKLLRSYQPKAQAI